MTSNLKNHLAKLTEFLGLRKSIVGILAMAILIGLGEKMGERFLPIYLAALGASEIAIGALNGLDNLLSALYSFPGGYLAERLGPRKALLIFNLLAASGFMIVIAIPHWIAVFIGAFFFLSWTAISLPATMGVVARSLPQHKRTMGVSMHSLVRRIPMAIGPILGGTFITIWGEITGMRIAFCGALFMTLLAIIFQQKLIEPDSKLHGKTQKSIGLMQYFINMPTSLKYLLIADILVRYCEQIPYAFIAIWCMKVIKNPVSAIQFSLLTTVEMATAMLVYIPVAYLADKTQKKPFVILTFGFFTIFPLLLYYARNFPVLIIAFVVRGLKEFGEPTRKALIMDLAPEEHKAGTFGAYYLLRDVTVSFSAFASGFLWKVSPALNFGTAFAFGVIGTLLFTILGSDCPAPNNSITDSDTAPPNGGDK